MSVNVRRGLGLLAVAALGWLLGMALLNAPTDGALGVLALAGLFVAVVVTIGGVVSGLGLLAWGLLRSPR